MLDFNAFFIIVTCAVLQNQILDLQEPDYIVELLVS
jgi:hypothetical protein